MTFCPALQAQIDANGIEQLRSRSGGIVRTDVGALIMQVWWYDEYRPWCHYHGTDERGLTVVCRDAIMSKRGNLSLSLPGARFTMSLPEPLPDLALRDSWE